MKRKIALVAVIAVLSILMASSVFAARGYLAGVDGSKSTTRYQGEANFYRALGGPFQFFERAWNTIRGGSQTSERDVNSASQAIWFGWENPDTVQRTSSGARDTERTRGHQNTIDYQDPIRWQQVMP